MRNLKEKRYWVWLSLIRNLGARRKIKLLELYKNPEKIYNLKIKELLKIDGIGEETVKNIMDSKNKQLLDYHIKYMEENNIDVIHIYEEDYPQQLKEIYDPPVTLYIKGNKKILNNKNIGIVGCRDCTDYGKKSAEYFAYNLSKKYINIVF